MSIFRGILNKTADIVDKVVSNKGEANRIKAEIQTQLSDVLIEVEEKRANIIVKEASGSWLQRNWRPLVMLSFAFIFVAVNFLFPLVNLFLRSETFEAFILSMSENREFYLTVQIGLGGYIGARTIEKVTDSLTKNKAI